MSLKRARQIKRKADADKIKAQKVWRVADWPLSIAIFPAYVIEGIEVTRKAINRPTLILWFVAALTWRCL